MSSCGFESYAIRQQQRCGSSGVERSVEDPRVGGSIPSRSTNIVSIGSACTNSYAKANKDEYTLRSISEAG